MKIFKIKLARKILRIGQYIRTLAIVVMRPNDLVEFSRQNYQVFHRKWTKEKLLTKGLTEQEEQLIQKIGISNGNLLLLGVGGGREAIPLGKMGFSITGVDFIPELIVFTEKYAKHNNISFIGLVQNYEELSVPKQSYQVVWLSNYMYSSIPTVKRRKLFLIRVKEALRTNGYFILQFEWRYNFKESNWSYALKKVLAYISMGYMGYEKGDILWQNREFLHIFHNEREIVKELEESGFKVLFTSLDNNKTNLGGMVVQKMN